MPENPILSRQAPHTTPCAGACIPEAPKPKAAEKGTLHFKKKTREKAANPKIRLLPTATRVEGWVLPMSRGSADMGLGVWAEFYGFIGSLLLDFSGTYLEGRGT